MIKMVDGCPIASAVRTPLILSSQWAASGAACRVHADGGVAAVNVGGVVGEGTKADRNAPPRRSGPVMFVRSGFVRFPLMGRLSISFDAEYSPGMSQPAAIRWMPYH